MQAIQNAVQKRQARLNQDIASFEAGGGKVQVIPFGESGLEEANRRTTKRHNIARRKLTSRQVKKIRQDFDRVTDAQLLIKMTTALAKKYKVHYNTIRQICGCQTWVNG